MNNGKSRNIQLSKQRDLWLTLLLVTCSCFILSRSKQQNQAPDLRDSPILSQFSNKLSNSAVFRRFYNFSNRFSVGVPTILQIFQVSNRFCQEIAASANTLIEAAGTRWGWQLQRLVVSQGPCLSSAQDWRSDVTELVNELIQNSWLMMINGY